MNVLIAFRMKIAEYSESNFCPPRISRKLGKPTTATSAGRERRISLQLACRVFPLIDLGPENISTKKNLSCAQPKCHYCGFPKTQPTCLISEQRRAQTCRVVQKVENRREWIIFTPRLDTERLRKEICLFLRVSQLLPHIHTQNQLLN